MVVQREAPLPDRDSWIKGTLASMPFRIRGSQLGETMGLGLVIEKQETEITFAAITAYLKWFDAR